VKEPAKAVERVSMRWPEGLKERIQDRVGPGLVTKFTVAAVEQGLSTQGWYIDAEICKTCGNAMVTGECWTCE
jgi:hypothetical protein